MFNRKFVIIVSFICVVIIATYGGSKALSTKSEFIGNVELFKIYDKEAKPDTEKVEETLSLKDVEDDEIKNTDNKTNINTDTIIINKPVVEHKETKNEITKEEIQKKVEYTTKKDATSNNVENVIKTSNITNTITASNNTDNNVDNQSKDVFVKFVKNEKSIANMEAMMFALVPTEWFFSSSKVVIDSDGIDENTEYITFNKLNQDVLKNKKSGDIKIFAYDEVWNNGKSDYVLQTRCYVK